MVWQIDLKRKARKKLKNLDPQNQKRILYYLHERAAENPRKLGKPLAGNKSGLWSYRVQDYRIICHIRDNKLTILVIDLGHRDKIYDQ